MKKLALITFGIIIILSVIVQLNTESVIEYRVGVIGNYTATNSTASVDAFRAIELALEKINTSDRIYTLVRFNIADYEDQKLIKKDIENKKIDFLIGPSTSSQYLMSKELLAGLEMPVFLISVSSNTVNELDDNLFRLTDTLELQVEEMSKTVERIIAGNRIILLYTTVNKGFSYPYAKDLQKKLVEQGKNVSIEEVKSLDRDETREALLKKKDTDAFVVIAGPSQAGIIAQILDVNNSTAPIFFSTWSKDERTIEYSINVRNDMYILSSPEPQSINEYEAFIKSLDEYRNVTMNSFAYFGYEIMFFADHVIKESESVKLKDVKAYIHDIDTYQGNYNEFHFNNTGDGGRGYTLMMIKDGAFKLITSNQ